MEGVQETQGEMSCMAELFRAWLADPFEVVVSFLAAVAVEDIEVEAK